MRQMLELDVEALAGKKGRHDPKRTAYRHGSERTKVVLGGEKRSVDKPRVRSISGAELPLPSLAQFQNVTGGAGEVAAWGEHSEVRRKHRASILRQRMHQQKRGESPVYRGAGADGHGVSYSKAWGCLPRDHDRRHEYWGNDSSGCHGNQE